MDAGQRARSFAASRLDAWVAELADLVAIPSVSGDPHRARDVGRAARWCADALRRAGVPDVRVLRTGGHPVVWGACDGAHGRPTVLVYGHYDVQSVEPEQAWRRPPFRPVVADGRLWGRGASDDKGQLLTHVKAVEALHAVAGRPPVNVRFVFEGEEEAGARGILRLLSERPDLFAADVAVVSDNEMLGPGRPAITCSLRGHVALELDVRGPDHDLHSGAFGGAVHNPLDALADMLAGLHDARGRVRVPGFYRSVRPGHGRAGRSRSASEIVRLAHVPRPWGERGYSVAERVTVRPMVTVNGISGGHQGPGSKGVIPARATAKLDARIVPDQDPAEVDRLLRHWIAAVAPPTVRVAVRTLVRSRPVELDVRHPAVAAAQEAYRVGFGRPAELVRSGGSIPFVSALSTRLGVPTVLMGFGLPDDRKHGPDESFSLDCFQRGIATSIEFLCRMGAQR